MKLKNNKKGFTLVELVIVIAVIAILAAVLIPTFTSVIDNANRASAQEEANALQTQILMETNGDFDKYVNAMADKDGEDTSNEGFARESAIVPAGLLVTDAAASTVKFEDVIGELASGGKIMFYKASSVEGTVHPALIVYTTKAGNVVHISASEIKVDDDLWILVKSGA